MIDAPCLASTENIDGVILVVEQNLSSEVIFKLIPKDSEGRSQTKTRVLEHSW